MNTLRTLTVIVVLAAVAYGVYASLNNKPVADPPGMTASDWNGAPTVELPGAPGAPGVAMPSGAPPTGNTVPPPAGYAAPPAGEATAGAPPFAPTELPPAPTGVAPGPADAAPVAAVQPPPYEQATPHHTTAPSATPDRYASPPPSGAPTDAAAMPPSADSPNYAEQTPLDAAPPAAAGAAPPVDAAAPPVDDRYAGGSAPGGAGSTEFNAALATVQTQLDQGQLAEAHLALSQWFGHPDLSSAQEQQLLDLLDQLAGTVIYSRQSLIEPPYVVQPGDTLQQIGQVYSVPAELLAKINGVPDPSNLTPGERLKVIRGPFAAVIELDRKRMSLWTDGRYAGRFMIGVGREAKLTEGEFTVRGKVPNPTYYGPEQVIDADDPANPLGEYWLDLGNQLGIHGTHDPATIGSADARGSIALSPRDIQDVYDILTESSTVVIRR